MELLEAMNRMKGDFEYIVKRVYAWFGFFTFWGGLVYGFVHVGQLVEAVSVIIK